MDHPNTADEIRDLLPHYEQDLYSKVRAEQKIDDSYWNDTFEVPEVKEPHQIYRSGIGHRMVEAPAEQLITSNPQVLIESKNEEVTKRLQTEITDWIEVLKRQGPNPFKETVKNALGRGESFIQVVHNADWVTGQKIRSGPPVLFIIPDSMVIYASPEEDAQGVPIELFVKYWRQPADVIYRYPDWTNPKQHTPEKKPHDKQNLVEWVEYWRNDIRYFQADGEAVLKAQRGMPRGIQKNIYGFVPFVRRYSGFGKRSPDGRLESLIVSDIRYSRDLIREETATRSDIASTLHLFAHKPITFQIPAGSLAADVDVESLADSIHLGAYDVNILELPDGSKKIEFDVLAPTPEMFQYLRDLRAEIAQRNPFVSPGPIGASGRQQDLTTMSARRRYETVAENTETLWATAFEMARRIVGKVPTLRPDGLHKEDVERDDVKIKMRLMADDPVEADRLATLGERLWNMGQGSIDLRTNLVEYQGKSPEKAEEIIVAKLVDKITLENPQVAAVLGMEFAREAGLQDEIEEAMALQAEQGASQGALSEMPAATTIQRNQGETETEAGRQMIDQSLASRGARRPPERFTRGG